VPTPAILWAATIEPCPAAWFPPAPAGPLLPPAPAALPHAEITPATAIEASPNTAACNLGFPLAVMKVLPCDLAEPTAPGPDIFIEILPDALICFRLYYAPGIRGVHRYNCS